MNTPYLYFGMWGATFSWHVEDMDLYGINFIHHGAPKTWYCVPPRFGYLLEEAAKRLFPNISSRCSNFMRHKTCLISPMLLKELGIPFQKVVQEERDMIVVFPYAYHAGFNHGFNIAESTNFGTERWIEYGKRHRPCDCTKYNVKLDMGIFVKRFQPELWDKWLKGDDIAPHPEDPEDVACRIRLRASDPEAYARLREEEMKSKDKNWQNITLQSGKQVKINRKSLKTRRMTSLSDQDKKELENWRSNSAKDTKRCIVTYQHVEMSHVKVRVFKHTLKCVGNGLHSLKEHLNKPDLSCISDLIDKGELIKVGEEYLPMRTRSNGVTSRLVLPVAAQVFKYYEDGSQVFLDPETRELLKRPSDLVQEKLALGVSIREMIASGHLIYHKRMVIRVCKRREFFADKCVRLFKHVSTGTEFKVSFVDNTVVGNGQKINELLKNTTFENALQHQQVQYLKTVPTG